MAKNGLCHAAQEEPGKTAMPVRSNEDEIGPLLAGVIYNGGSWVPLGDDPVSLNPVRRQSIDGRLHQSLGGFGFCDHERLDVRHAAISDRRAHHTEHASLCALGPWSFSNLAENGF